MPPLMLALIVVVLVKPIPAAWADTPMSYMHTSGPAGDPVTQLDWGLTSISLAVSTIIGLLILLGIFRRRPPMQLDDKGRVPIGAAPDGMLWIYVGICISILILLCTAIWNTFTLSAVAAPRTQPAFTVEIVGHQWWWEIKYPGVQPSQTLLTANEIHIPVGKPILFKLSSNDVIHSFWIPKLGGKTDVIPGQINRAWLQADHAGNYRGQCGEYCGVQHAYMAMYVIAEDRKQFDSWRTNQLHAAVLPSDPKALHGSKVFISNCGVCHTVLGTQALGQLGPDLTHLMSRSTLASGLLENNMGNLYGWVANPQGLKPGSRMPRVVLTPKELHDVIAYLETLK